MKIANTISVVTFVFNKNEKHRLESALGGKDSGYRFTALGNDKFRMEGRRDSSPKLHGDGYYKLSVSGKRKEKIYRVSIHNFKRIIVGSYYGSTGTTMSLKQDSDGTPWMELTVSPDKVKHTPRKDYEKKKTPEQKMQSVPIPVIEASNTLTLEKLYFARTLINDMVKNYPDSFILSLDENNKTLKFMMDSELSEEIKNGLLEQVTTVKNIKPVEMSPVPELIQVPGKTVESNKPGILGFFRGRKTA